MLRGKHGGDQDHAVHPLLVEGVEGFQLLCGVIESVDQQGVIAFFFKHADDAGHHVADGIGVELGEDDPDGLGFAGSEHLRLHRRAVSGLRDDPGDGLPLFGGEVAVVEVTGNGGVGHTGQFCDLRDGHRVLLCKWTAKRRLCAYPRARFVRAMRTG